MKSKESLSLLFLLSSSASSYSFAPSRLSRRAMVAATAGCSAAIFQPRRAGGADGVGAEAAGKAEKKKEKKKKGKALSQDGKVSGCCVCCGKRRIF